MISWLQKCNFHKDSLSPSEVIKVKWAALRSQMQKYCFWANFEKFLENKAFSVFIWDDFIFATSATSKRAEPILPKITFFKSLGPKKKNELYFGFIIKKKNFDFCEAATPSLSQFLCKQVMLCIIFTSFSSWFQKCSSWIDFWEAVCPLGWPMLCGIPIHS